MIGPSGFREIARSATVTYPIPFAFALCLAFSVISLGGAIVADGALRWTLVGFAGVVAAFALSMFTIAAILKPHLLRSERQEIRHRVMDFIEDSDVASEPLEVGRLMLEEPTTKGSATKSNRSRDGG